MDNKLVIQRTCHWIILLGIGTSILLSLVSCNGATEPSNGCITGKIYVDMGGAKLPPSNEDPSGFKVELYEKKDCDAELQIIVDKYPANSFIMNCQNTFDHRLQMALKETQTGLDGSFSMNDVPEGSYYIAIIKEGWSIKYIYDVIVQAGETTQIDSIWIYQSITMPSTVIESYTFKSDRSYIFDSDTIFTKDVWIQEGTQLFANEGSTLRFYGSINCPTSGFWRLDSADHIFETEITNGDSIGFFNGLMVFSESPQISNLMISHSSNAISSNSNSLIIQNCMISNSGSGVTTSNSKLNVSGLICERMSSTAVQCTGINQNCSIEKSVFYVSHNAISLYTGGGSSIENCYFYNNNFAIRVTSSSGEIQHNVFDNNYLDIYMERSSFRVEYNNFLYCVYMSIYPWSISALNQSIINWNNFLSTSYVFISVRSGSPPYSIVYSDLDARNNYWEPDELDTFLLDSLDNIQFPTMPCPRTIIYNPRKISMIPEAGLSLK